MNTTTGPKLRPKPLSLAYDFSMVDADQDIRQAAQVGEEQAGLRLDQAAAQLFPDYSRSRLKAWIDQGQLTLDGVPAKPRVSVVAGQTLQLQARLEADERFAAEPIPLSIIAEDEQVLVLDKPAGLVVHPAAGNWQGTLQNALLHHEPSLAQVPRAGIVHRLDKDTTGIMVVAKTLTAHRDLVEQLQQRSVKRQYAAICWGELVSGGSVDQPIGRHPQNRKKMAVTEQGKAAVTHYRIAEKLRGFTALRLGLETGRTHQIRVHMAWLRYPLVGDETYGGRRRQPAGASAALLAALDGFRRQALHAQHLAFDHPGSGDRVDFQAPLPADFVQLLEVIRVEAGPRE